jgi:hypothetical protein
MTANPARQFAKNVGPLLNCRTGWPEGAFAGLRRPADAYLAATAPASGQPATR